MRKALSLFPKKGGKSYERTYRRKKRRRRYPCGIGRAGDTFGEYSLARSILRQAAAVDMEDPEFYNLLGISYEKDGDRLKASRFYRVAYYMDQTFRPAALNLERVSEFAYQGSREIEWGLNITGGKKV